MRTAVIAVVLGVIILVVFLGSQQRRANERREREERVEKVVPELMLLDNKCVELAGRGDLTLEWTGNRDIKSDERQAVEAAQAKLAKVTADIPTLRAWLAEVAAFCSRAVDPREHAPRERR